MIAMQVVRFVLFLVIGLAALGGRATTLLALPLPVAARVLTRDAIERALTTGD